MDIRKTDRKRRVIVTLRLHDEEAARLKALAEAHFRSPGDQMRALIDEAHRIWLASLPLAIALEAGLRDRSAGVP